MPNLGTWTDRSQDLGNTNLTFFGTQHKPLPNLELIVRMLSRFDVRATITPRKDLAVNDRKVSGSAYRITGPRAYHHCTLLIDADLHTLWRVLHPDLPGLIDVRADLALTPVTDPRRPRPRRACAVT